MGIFMHMDGGVADDTDYLPLIRAAAHGSI